MPIDVDYRVMSTFLDFYITLMKFVNYKLYLMDGYQYPPENESIEDNAENGAVSEYLSYRIEKISRNSDIDDKYKIDEEFEHENLETEKFLLFKGLHFYLSTEVPRESLEYTILAMGGTITYEFDPQNQAITHVITDR